MTQRIPAIYQDGAFVPQVACDFPENAQVSLTVDDGPEVQQPAGISEEERKQRMKALLERMKNNPIPANAPKFTRDELHERS